MPIESLTKKLISPNIRIFVPPLAFLGALIIISVLAVRLGASRITTQRENLETARKNESVLNQKESILREVEGDIPIYVQTVASVLPEKNPALAMISQLKNLSALQVVVLGNFKVGSVTESTGLSNVDITFGVDGAVPQVVEFINAINNLAPISTLEKAKINQSAGSSRADVTIRVYYSPFPKELPALTEPQRNLTDEEKATLSKLATLTLPAFIKLSPQPGVLRENPFE